MAYSVIALKDLAELKSRRGTPANTTLATILGLNFPVVEAYTVYVWDDTSMATPDDNHIVQPTIGGITTGRWYKVDLDTVPQINSDWNSITGVAQILNKPVLSTIAISGNYNDLTGKPALSTVATTNLYSDLSGKPTIPAAQVSSDWNATTGNNQVLNKPNLTVYYLATNPAGYITTSTLTPYQLTSGLGTLAFSSATIPTNNNQLSNGAGYITNFTESDPVWTAAAPNYRTKTQNDSLYQALGTYVTTETDPTVPTYSKSLTSFSVIKSSTDTLYKDINYTPSYASLSGKPTTASGYGITDVYPLTGNPSNFISSFVELDPTVPAYAKTITGSSVIKALTDPLYKPINYIPSWTEVTSKPTFATVAVSGSYNDLSSKPVIPIVTRIERYSGVTSGVGTYTVVYTTPFSTIPHVNPVMIGASITNIIRITASSVTGFTITANNIINVAGLVPTYPTLNGLSIDVIVIDK